MACHLRLVNQVGDQLLYGGTGSGMGQIAQQLQHLHCAWRLAHGHGLAGFAGHDLGNVLRLYGAQDLQDLQQLAAGERGCAACPVARKEALHRPRHSSARSSSPRMRCHAASFWRPTSSYCAAILKGSSSPCSSNCLSGRCWAMQTEAWRLAWGSAACR